GHFFASPPAPPPNRGGDESEDGRKECLPHGRPCLTLLFFGYSYANSNYFPRAWRGSVCAGPARVGQPGRSTCGHREAARHQDGVPHERARADSRSRQIAVVPASEWNLEVPRLVAPVGAPDRFLPDGL